MCSKSLADAKGKKQGRLRIGEVEEQGSCDFKVSGECSVEEVTAEQKHEREEEAGSTDIWRKTVAGRKKTACAKTLEWGLLDASKEQRIGPHSVSTGGRLEGRRLRGRTLRVWSHCKGSLGLCF